MMLGVMDVDVCGWKIEVQKSSVYWTWRDHMDYADSGGNDKTHS